MRGFVLGAALAGLCATGAAALLAAPAHAQQGFRTPTTTCSANNAVCRGDCDTRLRNSPDLGLCHESCEKRQADCLQTGTYYWRTTPSQEGLRRE